MPNIKIKNTPGEPKSDKPITVKRTLKPVPRKDSNVETEKGEYVVSPLTGMGFPETYVVGGKPHSQGGTPLNLPDDSFVFSKDPPLTITNRDVLKRYKKEPKKAGYVPADLARQYDINQYLKVLVDPMSDRVQRETADIMIKNYNNKLGELALVQESMKGFPDSLPFISQPYLESMGIDPAAFVHGSGSGQPTVVDEDTDMEDRKAGGGLKVKITGTPKMQEGGVKETVEHKAESKKKIEEGVKRHGEKQGTLDYLVDVLSDKKNWDILPPPFPRSGSKKNTEKIQNLNEHLLRSQYNRAVTEMNKGNVSSDWSWLPGVTDATKAYGNFRKAAKAYGFDPDELMMKFEKERLTKRGTPSVDPAEQAIFDKMERGEWNRPPVFNDTLYVQTPNPFLKGGGQKLQNGGKPKVTKYPDGTTSTEMGDGTVVVKDAKGAVIKTIGPKSSSSSTTAIKKERVLRPTGQTHVYGDFVDAIGSASEKGLVPILPVSLEEQEGAVAKKQPGRETDPKKYEKLPPNVYGRKNWASAELFPDFANRHRWYFDQHPEFDPRKKDQVRDFQQAYNERLEGMGLPAYFTGKEERGLDGKFGEVTFSAPGFEQAPVPAAPGAAPETMLPALTRPDVELKTSQPAGDTPFWTQDLIKMAGAASDLARIKKYMPWQAGYATHLPVPTYFDPTRELGANAEQANIASQVIGSYAGPQSLNARLAETQGRALANAADIMGRYNNLNVQVANQNEMARVSILNQDSLNRANRATDLYDKGVIANQMYDNAKAQARQNLRQSFIDAWTNRGKTQALNSMNKQYRVDPRTGFVTHTGVPGRLETTPRVTIEQRFNSLMENPYLRSNPEIAYKMAKESAGVPDKEELDYFNRYSTALPQ